MFNQTNSIYWEVEPCELGSWERFSVGVGIWESQSSVLDILSLKTLSPRSEVC